MNAWVPHLGGRPEPALVAMAVVLLALIGLMIYIRKHW